MLAKRLVQLGATESSLAFAICAILFVPFAHADPPRDVPMDLHQAQWGLENTGQGILGKIDADIDGPEAWYISKGDSRIVIAVIDTGAYQSHLDLISNLWINPNDPDFDGDDDDGNGLVDDVHGWNFLDNSFNIEDTFGHGTQVAGIAAAESGSPPVGIIGTCPSCSLMILKVGNGNMFDPVAIRSALQYALENGAEIISLSFRSLIPDPDRRALLSQIAASGIPVVAAIGNDNNDQTTYPASWPEVLAVGASDRADNRWDPVIAGPDDGSSFGAHLDLVAPGSEIWTTTLDSLGTWQEVWGGTSFAAPFVSGTIGLMLDKRQDLHWGDIYRILKDSSDPDIGTSSILTLQGDSYFVGSGRLNAFKALTAVNFSDLHPRHWANRYARYALQECIIDQDGFGDGTFRPLQDVTRAETLKLSYEGAGLDVPQSCDGPGVFPDVDSSDWFYCYAKDAWTQGIIEGIPCSCTGNVCAPDGASTTRCFFGNQSVTRGEAAKIASLSFGFDPATPEEFINICTGSLKFFPDLPESHFSYRHVHWMANAALRDGPHPNRIPAGSTILSGYSQVASGAGNNFEPDQTINRAEMVKVVSAAKLYFESESHLGSCIVPEAKSQPLMLKGTPFGAVSIGSLYEQSTSIAANASAPEPFSCPGDGFITVSSAVPLVGHERDADQDELFYFWSADGGSFSTTDPVNFRAVTWYPPAVSEDAVFLIDVVNGDRRGLVGRSQCKILVSASGSGSNSPASGTLSGPSGTQTGNVTVQASATDADGLERVSVTFASGGQPLVLCGVDGPSPCSGTSESYSRSGVDPAAYGAAPGQVTMRLFVEDTAGDIDEVANRTFTYDPPGQGPSYTLTVRKQGDGDGTVSGNGINCGGGCTTQSLQFSEGTAVTLTATADANSVFIGFAGDRCYGMDPCNITMNQDLEVRVSFGLPDQLAVLFSTPGPGDANVSPSDQIIVTFNREVNEGPTFSDIIFREMNGHDVSFNAVISNTGSTPRRRLFLIPDQQLERGVAYEVEIPIAAVEDDAGNDLPLPYPLEFTVAEEDPPNMYVTAYPLQVMEGDETRLSVWFDSPATTARTITISSSPSGVLDHVSSIVLPAGEVLAEVQVDTVRNNSSTGHTGANLSVSASGFAQQSVPIQVYNSTPINGSSLRWLAASIVNDDNGNGILEAGEFADVRFEVWNSSSSTIFNVVLNLDVLNTGDIFLLGGSGGQTCNLGAIQSGRSESCERSIVVDDELPSGDYFMEVQGSSSGGGFLDQARLTVVNNQLPDYTVNLGAVTGSELDPGTVIRLDVHTRNAADGFNSSLVTFEVLIEIEGVEHLLYETVANARGHYYGTQSFELPIIVPSTPGTHFLRARINPAGTGQLPESNTANNSSQDVILRTREPNQPPVLDPLGGPYAVNVGEAFMLTATATDPNNDPITYSLGPGAPVGMSIGLSSGVLTWTPQCGQNGSTMVEVIATDNEQTSDSALVTIEIGTSANLQAALVASTNEAVPGTMVDWTLTVTNLGPSCVGAVEVNNLLPAELTDASWSCSSSAGSTCTASGSGDIADTVDLLAGGSATYALATRISDGAQGSVVNMASVAVTGAAIDPNQNNNTAADSITLRGLDYGDAPSPALGGQWLFPTHLTDDGARHGVDPQVFLGTVLDAETDGQPTLAADGDDLAGADDDDGVVFPGELEPCGDTTVDVTASVAGLLDAWIDYDTDGEWDEPEEQVFASEALVAGINTLPLSVPCSATPSALAFARFRFSSLGGLGLGGLALDGEVEDYGVLIAQVFRSLDVSRDGPGSGTVVASPNGIQCGDDCQELYPIGSVVVLSAPPDYGSTFLGWTGGGCSGTGTCVLEMSQDHAVNATFGLASFPLTVSLDGTGTGSVSSDPAGISCGASCTQEFTFGTMVTLSAAPAANSDFAGWTGGSCTGTDPCTVQVDQALTVTATFDLRQYPLMVVKDGTGSGTITDGSGAIDCGATCTADFVHGTGVTLNATPDTGSELSGWSGAGCSGTGSCTVTMDSAQSVTASFDLLTYLLEVSLDGTGTGTVTSSPPGIDCGSDCSEELSHGTSVTLTAAAGTGSDFVGWTGGGCSGTDPCTITMEAAAAVTATFDQVEHTLTVTKTGAGVGTVTSDPAGISCDPDCTAGFVHGTNVTLTAVAETGSFFEGWSGAGCSGTDPCEITLEETTAVTASFGLEEHTVTISKAGNGDGTISSDPAGIDCGVTCSVDFPYGTELTLEALPQIGSVFAGWSSVSCTGTADCTFTVVEPADLTATFDVECIDAFEDGAMNWTALTGPGDGGGTAPWTVVTSDSNSPTHSWFASDEDQIKDQLLQTEFRVPVSSGARLRFFHRFDTEAGFDGGVLEVSVDSGSTWFDILAGNGGTIPANPNRFLLNGYNSSISDCCSNPLANRAAWSGSSGGWVDVIVDLADFAGHQLVLRWRIGGDLANGGAGWWIDDVAFGTSTCPFGPIFSDGFESGDTLQWSGTIP